MLSIAICDDNAYVCAQLKDFCAKFLGNSINYELLVFNNGSKLISYKRKIDILFLDIEMPVLNGFDAARELKKRNQEICIIFITSHAEMMQDAFKVKAFRYLVKPVNMKDMKESLIDAIKDISDGIKVFIDCNTSDGKIDIIVYEKNIIYIESIGDSTVIYTLNQGDLISRKTLKYWTVTLTEPAFFQTHKSFIVSLAHVAGIRKSSVITMDGKELPLAKRKVTAFKKCIAEHIKSI